MWPHHHQYSIPRNTITATKRPNNTNSLTAAITPAHVGQCRSAGTCSMRRSTMDARSARSPHSNFGQTCDGHDCLRCCLRHSLLFRMACSMSRSWRLGARSSCNYTATSGAKHVGSSWRGLPGRETVDLNPDKSHANHTTRLSARSSVPISMSLCLRKL